MSEWLDGYVNRVDINPSMLQNIQRRLVLYYNSFIHPF